MKTLWAILGGVGFGAFLMYIFDPKSGNDRRTLVRDKAVGLTHDIQDTFDKTSKDLSNRAKGLLQETKSIFTKGTEETENAESRPNGLDRAGETGGQPNAHTQAA